MSLKRELIYFRKQVWPIRELLSHLMHEESRLIQESSHIFFRDVYDHTIQLMDTVESLRDALTGMQDLYLFTLSNKMNEVMKVLTMIATIFIPLTFIAGVGVEMGVSCFVGNIDRHFCIYAIVV